MPDTCLIRELPESERPRERLLEQGSGSLSDAELVVVLLRTGHVGPSAVQLARTLLDENGGLPGLLGATPQLLRRKGLGPAKAAGLLAALEVARRLAHKEIRERVFPTPVGMNRRVASVYDAGAGVPHTCGDEPDCCSPRSYTPRWTAKDPRRGNTGDVGVASVDIRGV